MAPYDEVFTRLDTGDETRKRAQSLYIQAAQLTTHGSGRRLGQGHSALVAICAFLASQRLGNGEVTKAQACAAACVDPRTFEIALSNVESVLRTVSSPQPNQKALTFWDLSKEYASREDACVPMAEVEATLKACGAQMDGIPIDPKSPLIQCAIFYWVCTVILRVTVPDVAHFREMLKASPKKWVASQRVVEKCCSHMVDDLTRKAKTALTARTTRSRQRAGTRERVQASLINLTSRSNGPFVPLTPPKTPLNHNIKRKTFEGTGSKENDSPSKRAKASSYVPSGLGQDLSTHTPIARRTNVASLSQPAALREDNSEDDEVPNSTIVVRLTQSSRKQVDHSAWNSQRPRMTTTGCGLVTPSSSTQGSPSVGATSQVREGRVRHQSPSVKKPAFSVQEDEISRRRRRNLRATFLDPSMYGWKPDVQTIKKLERARIWESHMVERHGDPWDG